LFGVLGFWGFGDEDYFKRYQTYGDLNDLKRAKESQVRANDYLQKANIWK